MKTIHKNGTLVLNRFIPLIVAATLVWGACVRVYGQANDSFNPGQANNDGSNPASGRQVTLPAGTTVLLHLNSPIDTHSARVGDGVYCQTSFPVTIDNTMAIPGGTYVKGHITRVKRSGRIIGRAELQVHFTTMIFPNGYTIELPGALQNTQGAENSSVTDKEGTIKANGQIGKDAAKVVKGGAAGVAIGGSVGSIKGAGGILRGAGIGAGIGGGLALIGVLADRMATRGEEVRLPSGTSLEMVLQQPLTVEVGNELGHSNIRPLSGQNTSLQVH